MTKKLVTILILIVVALVVLLGVYWMYQGSPSIAPEVNNTQTASEDNPVNETPASSPAASLSYANALITYADRRLQFDSACVATPNNVTYKNGTDIMLDNRSKTSRTISVNGQVYTIRAWGFRIIDLTTTKTLPQTMLVDCGNGQNQATIILQK